MYDLFFSLKLTTIFTYFTNELLAKQANFAALPSYSSASSKLNSFNLLIIVPNLYQIINFHFKYVSKPEILPESN